MKATPYPRPNYRRKSKTCGDGAVAVEENPIPRVLEEQGEDARFLQIIAQKKAEGYAPIHWRAHEKGIRALQVGGKVMIPSSYTKGRVCMIHGNLVKVRHETHADQDEQGIRILDVLPCLFCAKDPVGLIQRSPETK